MAMPRSPFTIRPLAPGDSLADLTGLLHRAYAPLAEAGLNFTAASQTEKVTRHRVAGGHALVAAGDGRLLGTVTVNGPFDPNAQPWARATPWFYRRDVAHLHQYAVEPSAQGSGIGQALLRGVEDWALQGGFRAIALDTAQPASHLRQRYERAGYAEVAQVQWDGKTYRSVVMVKPLALQPADAPARAVPTDTDTEHHAAMVRVLWACFQARDWSAARRLLADDAQMAWRASGEHFDSADAIIRVNAIYPEGWVLRILDVTPLQDGRIHSLVQVRHGDACFYGHSLFTLAGRHITRIDETWATAEEPPAWRTAAAIGAYRRIDAPHGPSLERTPTTAP